MASVQIYRYEIISNPYIGSGSLLAVGDVLDVYIDTSLSVVPSSVFSFQSAGITVFKNSAPYPAVEVYFSILTKDVHFVLQDFSPQVCIGTSLLVFGSWQYDKLAFYYSQENHYSCAVNPSTCDLLIIGVPEVISTTDSTSTDGQITVTAISTNTIEYKIGSDFVYGDGSAQTTGVFAALLTGSYRIFLRDSVNCGVNILVNVPVNNTYGTKFRLEYEDLNGGQTKLDITRRAYSGAITEVCGTGNPFQLKLRGEGSLDKFDPIPGSQGDLSLVSETDLQFLELYTNDPNLYRLNYYKDLGSGYELKWTGKILPQLHEEEYKAPPYYVSIVSSDGLPELSKSFLVQQDGQKYYGTVSLIKLVAYCLSTLKIDLNIRCGVNLYAVEGSSIFDTTYGMNVTDSDDPFDQAYIDYECFYLAEEIPTLDFVLRSVLEPFGARLMQWENKWNIVRVEELISDFDYREFDSSGNYISNDSYSPVVDLDFPSNTNDLLFVNADQNLEIKPGYGTIKAVYKLGLKPNILRNGDFRLRAEYNALFDKYTFVVNKDGFLIVNAGYTINESIEYIDDNNIALILNSGSDTTGEAYIKSDSYLIKMGTNNQLKIGVRCKVHVSSVLFGNTVYTTKVHYTKLRVMVKYGSLYLQSNGSWTSTLNILTFFFTEFDKYLDFEITANQPLSGTPASGMDFEVRVYQAYPFHYQFSALADLKAFDTYTGGNQVAATGYRTELLVDSSFDSLYYYELEESTDTPNDYSIVRPDDYNGGTNPRQWILKDVSWFNFIDGTMNYSFFVDKIYVKFLTDGKEPYDTITRTLPAESNNKDLYEKQLIIGSYSTLVVTDRSFGIDLGVFFPGSSGVNIVTSNILSAETIYTGYLRDADGNGYEFFKRDGVAESDKLHSIFLKSVTEQYKRPWRLLRGSIKLQTNYFGLLNTIREVNDNNRIYVPSGLSLDDKACIYTGEFLELSNSVTASGSDGSGSAPYSSGFSIGYGSSAFN